MKTQPAIFRILALVLISTGFIHLAIGQSVGNLEYVASVNPATYFPDGRMVHTVRANESLYDISTLYNVTVEELISINKLQSRAVYIGQELLIRADASSNTRNLAAPTTYEFHEVAEGESLDNIADRYDVPADSLISWNGQTTFYPKDVIRVRKVMRTSALPATPATYGLQPQATRGADASTATYPAANPAPANTATARTMSPNTARYNAPAAASPTEETTDSPIQMRTESLDLARLMPSLREQTTATDAAEGSNPQTPENENETDETDEAEADEESNAASEAAQTATMRQIAPASPTTTMPDARIGMNNPPIAIPPSPLDTPPGQPAEEEEEDNDDEEDDEEDDEDGATISATIPAVQPTPAPVVPAPVVPAPVVPAPMIAIQQTPAPVVSEVFPAPVKPAATNTPAPTAPVTPATLEEGMLETGAFAEIPASSGSERFFIHHKNLPVGTPVRLMLPNGAGFVSAKVTAMLDDAHTERFALSAGCVAVLRAAGVTANKATLAYK